MERGDCFGRSKPVTVAENLIFWAKYCHSVYKQKLFQNFEARNVMKYVVKCKWKGKYIVPLSKNIPCLLLGLSNEDIKLLSPFQIDVGKYVMKPYGYRSKSGVFALIVKQTKVHDMIEDIDCAERKQRFVATNFV